MKTCRSSLLMCPPCVLWTSIFKIKLAQSCEKRRLVLVVIGPPYFWLKIWSDQNPKNKLVGRVNLGLLRSVDGPPTRMTKNSFDQFIFYFSLFTKAMSDHVCVYRIGDSTLRRDCWLKEHIFARRAKHSTVGRVTTNYYVSHS